jgi:hypothetical protein
MNNGQEAIRDLSAGVQSELEIAQKNLHGIRSQIHSNLALRKSRRSVEPLHHTSSIEISPKEHL